MREYKPRRCSKRWLDGDCPDGVLAIIDHGANQADRYDVVFAGTYAHDDPRGPWVGYVNVDDDGSFYHGEMPAHEMAAYRYRVKGRYARWSDLPEAVKAVVRRDLGA